MRNRWAQPLTVTGSLEGHSKYFLSLLQDRDGLISREEMEDIVGSVFDLMGRTGDPAAEEELITERVDRIFEVS